MTDISADQRLTSRQPGWVTTVFADLLAGAAVALALIPEAIAFSLIVGVDPQVGLYASFTMAVTTAFLGSRPAMISGATGAMALLLVDLVKNYGLEYLLATTLVTGLLQVIWGALQMGRLVRYVPRAVIAGFMNALAILIFKSQLGQFAIANEAQFLNGDNTLMYVMVAAGLAMIYGLPLLTKTLPPSQNITSQNITSQNTTSPKMTSQKRPWHSLRIILQAIPSPLVAVVVLTATTVATGIRLPTVNDMGTLPSTLPFFHLPDLPLNLETLQIVMPVALPLSAVGLLASFLTVSQLDEITNTHSDQDQVARGQGIANLMTGLFGGMAGCAMLGQSVMNVKAGGRRQLSTLSAGLFSLFFMLILREWVGRIPMAALVAVMFTVAFSTVNWDALKKLHQRPKHDTAVMITTVMVTLMTNNLALGVVVGMALSATPMENASR